VKRRPNPDGSKRQVTLIQAIADQMTTCAPPICARSTRYPDPQPLRHETRKFMNPVDTGHLVPIESHFA
jgi:hypothetical protein